MEPLRSGFSSLWIDVYKRQHPLRPFILIGKRHRISHIVRHFFVHAHHSQTHIISIIYAVSSNECERAVPRSEIFCGETALFQNSLFNCLSTVTESPSVPAVPPAGSRRPRLYHLSATSPVCRCADRSDKFRFWIPHLSDTVYPLCG